MRVRVRRGRRVGMGGDDDIPFAPMASYRVWVIITAASLHCLTLLPLDSLLC